VDHSLRLHQQHGAAVGCQQNVARRPELPNILLYIVIKIFIETRKKANFERIVAKTRTKFTIVLINVSVYFSVYLTTSKTVIAFYLKYMWYMFGLIFSIVKHTEPAKRNLFAN
jgi:hypothetical protein